MTVSSVPRSLPVALELLGSPPETQLTLVLPLLLYRRLLIATYASRHYLHHSHRIDVASCYAHHPLPILCSTCTHGLSRIRNARVLTKHSMFNQPIQSPKAL